MTLNEFYRFTDGTPILPIGKRIKVKQINKTNTDLWQSKGLNSIIKNMHRHFHRSRVENTVYEIPVSISTVRNYVYDCNNKNQILWLNEH